MHSVQCNGCFGADFQGAAKLKNDSFLLFIGLGPLRSLGSSLPGLAIGGPILAIAAGHW